MAKKKTLIRAIWVVLILAVLWHLGRWRSRHESSLTLCGELRFLAASKKESTFEGDTALRGGREIWILSPRWRGAGLHNAKDSVGFSGLVILKASMFRALVEGTTFGHKIQVSGRFSCLEEAQNPSKNSLLERFFRRPRIYLRGKPTRVKILPAQKGTLTHWHNRWYRLLEESLKGFPRTYDWVLAVWTGEEGGFGKRFIKYFQMGGLLPLVALSGQHVVILSILLGFFVRKFFRISHRFQFRRFYPKPIHVYLILPLFCTLLLTFTSLGSPSVMRTLGVVTLRFFVAVSGMRSSSLQMASSGIALLILWDPYLINDVGFILSAVATMLLIEISFHGESGWRQVKEILFISIVMPILMYPVCAYYFAKISLAAPVASLFFALLWDLFVIPIGFLLPILIGIFPRTVTIFMLSGVEKLAEKLFQVSEPLEIFFQQGFLTVYRPTLLETILLEAVFLALALIFCYQRGEIEGEIYYGKR